MKRIHFFLLFLLFNMVIVSCNNDEISYSCDYSTNEWVKSNLAQIHKMNILDWKMLDDSLKIPVYRAFTHKQRIDFWREKFKEIKAQDWTKDELLHIEKAELFLNNHLDLLSDKKLTDDQLDELEVFGYMWMNEGMEKFEWTPIVGNYIIGSGITIYNYSRIEPTRAPVPPLKCHCHGGNLVFHPCYADFTECRKTDKCDSNTASGCGFFMQEECDGLCMY